MDPAPVTDRPPEGVTGTVCPVDHEGPTDLAAIETDGPASDCPVPHAAPAPTADRCPVPLGAVVPADTEQGAACPVMHGAGPGQRTKADLIVRRLLRIPDSPPRATSATAYRGFQRSMLISGTRCTLTYVVFPFLLPLLHVLEGGAPIIGALVGSVALVSDTFTIRRFFAVDHKWRWYFSGLALAVMALLSVLLVEDLVDLVTQFG